MISVSTKFLVYRCSLSNCTYIIKDIIFMPGGGGGGALDFHLDGGGCRWGSKT